MAPGYGRHRDRRKPRQVKARARQFERARVVERPYRLKLPSRRCRSHRGVRTGATTRTATSTRAILHQSSITFSGDSSMKAVRIENFNDVPAIKDVLIPDIAPDQVLVRVK